MNAASSPTSRTSSAFVASDLALVFNFTMTAAIIALLLARVDNSASDAVIRSLRYWP